LMDVRMPVMDGIEATRRLVGRPNAPRVLILTTFDLDEYVYDALRAGASGFLLKRSSRDELINAVRVIADGDALLAPPVTRRLIDRFADNHLDPAVAERLDVLTAREREVLVLVAKGNSNAEIAAALHLTEHTVKTHVSRMLTKTGLRDRVQAVILAYDTGLVSAGQRT
jgi:DNA-binding NarL/FixJ family response regulator